jgi:uncharacterized membrane protein YedE/YeeE
MQSFTPLESTLGGLLVGLGSVGILHFHARVAGVAGILGGLVPPRPRDALWRACFALGLVLAGVVAAFVAPERLSLRGTLSLPYLALGGVLVGFGARLGGGCTSGHGVCGLGRFSLRSLVATLTFMTTAGLCVYLVRHVLGAG